MAASAGGIRAGRSYVEVGANDSSLVAGLRRAETRLKAFGGSVRAIGKSLSALGAGAATPFGASVKVFSDYETELSKLRAAANPTAEELRKIEASIADISKQTGAGPAKVAATMTELLKAGMSVESVMGGAARATLQFAKVAEMDGAEAAIVLSDAMNVFGTDATTSVDTLSRAADASSISVQDVAMAFSQTAAVAKMANQTIGDTANAIAILGQNGVKGSDAGTSLKSMLLRLQTEAGPAGDRMKELGINVRQANGQMKPMRGIIGELQARLAGLKGQARDAAMLDLFGTDAIRAGTILIGSGVNAWDEFNAKMSEGLPVAQKYAILMNTLGGFAKSAFAAIQRIGVEVGRALAPMIGALAKNFQVAANALALLARNNQGLVLTLAKGAAIVVGLGGSLVVLGIAISALGAGLGGIATVFAGIGAAIGAILSPVGLIAAGVVGATLAFLQFTETGRTGLATLGTMFSDLSSRATQAFGGIADALKAGDLQLAAKILWQSLTVEWLSGTNQLNKIWQDWKTGVVTVFAGMSFELSRIMVDTWAGIRVGFVNLIAFLKNGWNGFAGFFAEVWARIKALFKGKDATAEIDAIRADVAGKNAGNNASAQASKDQIRGTQDIANQALDDQQAAADEARFAASREAIKAGHAELDQAKADLKASLEAAKTKASEVPAASQDAPGQAKKQLQDTAGIEAGIAVAQRSVEVKGVLGGNNLQGLGFGDSLSDAAKNQTKELKTANAKLDKLNRTVELAGGLT